MSSRKGKLSSMLGREEMLSHADLMEIRARENVVSIHQHRQEVEQKKTKAFGNELIEMFSGHIPDDICGATFDQLKREHALQIKIIDAARKFTSDLINGQSDGKNLILTGPPGTGKSHMAMAVKNISAQHGLFAGYVSMPHVVRYLHQCVQRETGKSVSHALDVLTRPDVLILDELGRYHSSRFNNQFVWDLIDARHRAKRSTIVATNSTLAELSELLDPAAMSRLTDRGTVLMQCDWPSYRGRR